MVLLENIIKHFYYDNHNNLTNVEVRFNYSKFPSYKKDIKLNDKVGTIDFETFGSNTGNGYHKVYAGGWAVEGDTNLFYKNKN